eukprot:9467046-Pyramimonas_sp.AAC.2
MLAVGAACSPVSTSTHIKQATVSGGPFTLGGAFVRERVQPIEAYGLLTNSQLYGGRTSCLYRSPCP